MKKTLRKCDKLRLKSEFDYLRENGRKYVGRYVVCVVAPPPDHKLRCGIICGRKFSTKAVTRNRARRLLWESFRLLKPGIRPCHIVLITRNWIKNKKQMEVQKDLEKQLKKAGFLQKS